MYILIIFWWGSYAGQLQHIEFPNKHSCLAAKQHLDVFQKGVSGSVRITCVEKNPLP